MGYRTGRRYRYDPPASDSSGALLFWAEKGSVCVVDERLPESDDTFFTVKSVREWLEILRAFNRSLHRFKYADERHCAQNMIDNGIACAKEAKRQGDPCDPKHARDMLLARRRSMLLAGRGDYFRQGALSACVAPEALVLPPMPRGRRVLLPSDLE